ncbi:phosphonate C-P lyase system protein PhnL [Dendrosporobacter sp. 1207_IL3150]|uniref:phosphonate C-P lyase system protein PhnL n=1 Tax=Dendrosporobacter sp. 1207_IL3150 TaxID=3084054 RepID=UPI002FD9F9D1
MTALLEIENLGKSFTIHSIDKHIHASQQINISLNNGEFVGIVGKSGSGKSTILKCIYRTYSPSNGEIWYNSQKFGRINMAAASERQIIYLRRYEIGYVSQFLSVMPRTTAIEIVEQALLDMGYAKDYCRQQAVKMLTHFELDEELWDSYPTNFSGGEKLRLNIARAMVKRPRLLLLDEPTASLDNASKVKVRELIEQLKAEGTTMLGIFHDIEFMQGVCDKQFNISAGQLV